MFRILVLHRRDSIHTVIKYLLYRYDLVFTCDVNDAIKKLNEDNIDLILLDLPLENGSVSVWNMLKEWTEKKKTIAIIDVISPELVDEAGRIGVLLCIDKLEMSRLPELVSGYLNQAKTRVLE